MDVISKKSKKKKRRSKKQAIDTNGVDIRDPMHANMGASDNTGEDRKAANDESKIHLLETDLTVQLMAGNLQTNAGSTGNLSEGSVNRKREKRRERKKRKKAAAKDKIQSMDQIEVVAGSTGNLSEGSVNRKREKRREKKKRRKAAIKAEIQSTDQIEIDAGSKENMVEGNVNVKKKRQKKRVKKAKTEDEVQSAEQTTMDAQPTEIIAEEKMTSKRKKKRKNSNKAKAEDEVESMGQDRMDTGKQTVNLAKENNNAKIEDEAQSMDHNKMDTGRPSENLAGGNMTGQRKRKRKCSKTVKTKDEVQSMDKMETAQPTENISEGNNKAKTENEVESMDQNKMDTGGQSENLAEGNMIGKRKKRRKRSNKGKTDDEVQSMVQNEKETVRPTENLAEGNNKAKTEVEVQSMDQNKMDPGPIESVAGGFVTAKGNRTGTSVISSCDVKGNTHFSLFDLKDVECLHPKLSTKRKLLVLDVNGLLADIVYPAPKHCRGDVHMSGRAIFRRPFCDDFLKFCFQNFDVGIWSSRSKWLIDKVVTYLLGDLKYRLKFCWDMQHSTQTGFKTLENVHKPLVCKELRKIWENDGPNLRWKKGGYNESNTLLLDDSPYKALLNPVHTAIFPHSFCYTDKNDNSLGPKGDLRVYLEGVVTCENVQKYVEQHPFGQRAIDEQNVSWDFYAMVLRRMSPTN